ncbi:MAG: hypothetical protein IPL53_20775 [Ignavibacteria bacterium]|nr:hypothetical protein [Ignavibacteria bacterium]
MSKDSLLVKQVTFIIVVRRIKLLGIAITVGLVAIYGMGLIVANNNVKENFEMVNLMTLAILIMTVPLSILIRNLLLKKVNMSNFQTTYFNAHIIPFAVMDFAALFCITTNLFVNGIILYASIGVVISVAGMILNFPKEEYFEKLK